MMQTSEKRMDVLVGIALAATAVLAFMGVLQNDFVNYDDPAYVTANPFVQNGLSFDSVKKALFYTKTSNWHPLTWLSIMLDVELFGMNPAGHHLTNLLLHTANTVLLFIVLRRMTGGRWASAFVAVLFGIHPLHVEPVAWVSSRKDVLSALFFLLMVLAYHWYTRKPGVLRNLVVTVLFVLGFMAKAMLVTAPCVLLLLDYWPLKRFAEAPPFDKAALRRTATLVLEKLHLFALAIAGAIVTSATGRTATVSMGDYPLHYRIASTLVSYGAYMADTVWPSKLVPFYPVRGETTIFWQGLGSLFVLAAIFIFVFTMRKRCPALVVGWLLFVGMLAPVSMIVLVGSASRADRYMYVPIIGLFIMAAWGIPRLVSARPHGRIWLATAALIVLAALFCCTVRQVGHWRNSITLFQYTVDAYPNNPLAHNNLGVALEAAGRKEEAVAHYLEALRIQPYYVDALFYLGSNLVERGLVDEAIPLLSQAVTLEPENAKGHFGLGRAFSRKGRWDEAAQHFMRAIELQPNWEKAYSNMGFALLAKGDPVAAAEAFSAALKLEPTDTESMFYLGVALMKQGKGDEAAKQFTAVLERLPESHPLRTKAGKLLAQLRRGQSGE